MASPFTYPIATRLRSRVRSLGPGTYIATSTDPAYAQLKGMVFERKASPITDRFLPGGARELVAVVGQFRRNESEGAWEEAQVKFSPRFFENFRRDYARFEEAWWREVIQNAVDAGATEITLGHELNEDGTHRVWCDDNGRGMERDAFENVFLALGSTTKTDSPGQRGGFGKARELILFPWLGWEVVTNELQAKGIAFGGPEGQARPIIRKIPRRKGTYVGVLMPSDSFTDHSFSESYLEKCLLPLVNFNLVTIQEHGQREQPKIAIFDPPGEIIDEIPGLCKFKFFSHHTHRGFYFRVLGQYLFRMGLNADADGGILVDILVKSTDVLTANRDSLSDSPQGQAIKERIDRISQRLSTDKLSAQKARKSGLLHEAKTLGNSSHKAMCARILEALPPLPYIESEDEGVRIDPSKLDGIMKQVESVLLWQAPQDRLYLTTCFGDWARQALSLLYVRGQNQYETAVQHLAWTPPFAVYTQDGTDWALGNNWQKLMPENMTDRLVSTAKLWIEVCRLVLMHMNDFEPWGVGFVLGDKYDGTVAATLRDYDERYWLLFNPMYELTPKDISKPGAWRELVGTAVHECTHFVDGFVRGNVRGHRVDELEQGGHDETFASALSRNIGLAAPVFEAERFMLKQVPEIRAAIPRKHDTESRLLKAAEALEWVLEEYPKIAQMDYEDRWNYVNRRGQSGRRMIWTLVHALTGWVDEATPRNEVEFENYTLYTLCGSDDPKKHTKGAYLRLHGTFGGGIDFLPPQHADDMGEITLYQVPDLPDLSSEVFTQILDRVKPYLVAPQRLSTRHAARKVPEDKIVPALTALLALEQTMEIDRLRVDEEHAITLVAFLKQYLQFGRNQYWWPERESIYLVDHLLKDAEHQLPAEAGYLAINTHRMPITWVLKTQSPEMIWKWNLLVEYVEAHPGPEMPKLSHARFEPSRSGG